MEIVPEEFGFSEDASNFDLTSEVTGFLEDWSVIDNVPEEEGKSTHSTTCI